jgi:hypothetical protein
MLLGLWAAAIVTGFAMIHWGLETPLNVAPGVAHFTTYLYMSGTTFFTLGLGDVTPLGWPGRALVVIEAGLGFAFLAAVIAYLPAILYQAFSRREVSISLLNARAGSPPADGNKAVLITHDKTATAPTVMVYAAGVTERARGAAGKRLRKIASSVSMASTMRSVRSTTAVSLSAGSARSWAWTGRSAGIGSGCARFLNAGAK